MRLLECLWFFVAHFDIDVKCRHIPGVNNSTVDHLSHNNLRTCLLSFTPTGITPTNVVTPTSASDGWTRLCISSLRAAVQQYYQKDLASSTHRCYTEGQRWYIHFALPIT